jgi:tetratricopeptide (TPR) repeat protein
MIRFGPFLALAILIATPLVAYPARAEESAPRPTLRLPGMAPIPLPPRGHGLEAVPGDDEPQPEQNLIAPPRKPDDSASEKPKTSPPAPSRAEMLDDLYARLAVSKDAEETAGIVAAIDRLELISGSDAGDLLMARVIAAMGAKNYEVALDLLDKIVDLHPEWAEAWNKRATVRFLLDDDEGSMTDIAHVLKIEPRHFGALSGMGMILERRGFRNDALRAYRRALEIAPQSETLKNSVERLTKAVEGEDL